MEFTVDEVTKDEKEEIKSVPASKSTFEVDSEKVEFTSGIKFMFKDKIMEFRKGDIRKISRELRDLLLARGCINLKV